MLYFTPINSDVQYPLELYIKNTASYMIDI